MKKLKPVLITILFEKDKMNRDYELPQELWCDVMSYFHSAYKRPLHYNAIMSCKYFKKRRNINIDWGLSPLCTQSKYGVFDSYYIWIVLNNWTYWEFYDLNIVKPERTLNRKVAQGKVKKDFQDIWKTYAIHSNGQNLLSRIKY